MPETIQFVGRLAAPEGRVRSLSCPCDELSLDVDAVGAEELWQELSGFLATQAAAGRVVAGVIGYEVLHALEQVPRLDRQPGEPALADLHVVAFAEERTEPLRAPTAGALTAAPSLLEAADRDFTDDEYEARVLAARDAIHEGELFEVCMTQSLRVPCAQESGQLFDRLAELSPARCSALLDLPGVAVVSNSPETLLEVRGRGLRSLPIKGTRSRVPDAEADARVALELLQSPKDRAELAMIVDVTRNDLGRVATTGSVRVVEAARVHTVANVHHLEADVQAELLPGLGALDALRAIFPGGSVTGAPKVRAMQEIASLERTRRGPYCGAMVVFEPTGDMTASVAIRTGVLAEGVLHLHSGGAVTAESDPRSERLEMEHKARALLEAVAS